MSGYWGRLNSWNWGFGKWGHGHHQPPVDPSVIVPEVSLTPAYQPLEGVLLGDQRADVVWHLRDLNGDGDASDEGETIVFFDETNASGLPDPTGNIFNVHQASDGTVYVGDGNTDSVYALNDLNGDGDANDAGEASVWFSAENAGGLPFVTPNGIAEGPDGAIYLVNPGVVAGPFDDAVYRTVDLNNDGDANDLGEATVWLDLKTLNASSSAFDISFAGDVAFISDTNGGDPDTIYRAEDTNGNGTIDPGEAKVFIDEDNPFGAPVAFTHAVQGDSVLTWQFLPSGGISSVYRLTDLNGSGDIDQAAEAQEVWNSSLLPEGFDVFVGFSIAASENGDVAITSNGGPNQRNVIRLTDLNGDGDFFDFGETIVAVSNALDPDIAERPRAVAFYDDGTPDPHPQTYEEGGPAIEFATDLAITDTDSTLLGGAVVKIVGGLDPKHDLLSVELPKHSGVHAHYDPKEGTLTLKGLASAETYQEILQSLSFESRTDDPDETLRQIEITVQDERGEDGSSTAVATTIAVEANPDLNTIFGSDRSNFLKGTNQDDQIVAGDGIDVVDGRAGNDVLIGGPGWDKLKGGPGDDTFIFTSESDTDVITDFDPLHDNVVLKDITLNGEAIESLDEASAAAQSFGPNVTIYNFDNDATLWIIEDHGLYG
ncbi:MAG: hypothetical protein AAF563_11995 [Pseudomonadota bacterium]